MKKFLIGAALIFSAMPGVVLAQAGNPCNAGDTPPVGYDCSDGELFMNASNPLSGGGGNFVPLTNIPGLTDIQPSEKGLADFLNNLYKFLIGFAAAAAVVEIVWGGLLIASQDSISKKGEGREKIQQAILGLVLVLSPVLVFSIINPGILNLNINMQPLTLSSGSPGGGQPGGTPNTTPTPTTGCSSPTGTYIKRVTCATTADAETWLSSCSRPGKIDFSGSHVQVTKATCSGGYNSAGTCLGGATPAKTYCEGGPSPSYTFVDIGSGSGGGVSQYFFGTFQVADQDAAAVSQFKTACRGDGGQVCASRGTGQSSVTCPPYSFSVPNANPYCYRASLFCDAGSLSSTPVCEKTITIK